MEEAQAPGHVTSSGSAFNDKSPQNSSFSTDNAAARATSARLRPNGLNESTHACAYTNTHLSTAASTTTAAATIAGKNSPRVPEGAEKACTSKKPAISAARVQTLYEIAAKFNKTLNRLVSYAKPTIAAEASRAAAELREALTEAYRPSPTATTAITAETVEKAVEKAVKNAAPKTWAQKAATGLGSTEAAKQLLNPPLKTAQVPLDTRKERSILVKIVED